MAVHLERRQWLPEGTQPLSIGGTPGVGLEDRGIFSLVDGDEIRWTVAVRWSDARCPFEGMLVWEQACCALVGAHAELYALDLATATMRGHWDVGFYFSELVRSPDAQTVFVLGARSVLASRQTSGCAGSLPRSPSTGSGSCASRPTNSCWTPRWTRQAAGAASP